MPSAVVVVVLSSGVVTVEVPLFTPLFIVSTVFELLLDEELLLVFVLVFELQLLVVVLEVVVPVLRVG